MTELTTDEAPGGEAAPETKRDRVRRLLLDPLGFRWPKGTDEAEGRRTLDGIADELAYMTDASLEALRGILAPKGEGSSRCFWPARATFVGFAEVVQPRPVGEIPALVRWFRSVEGPRAVAEGTLVETWSWFEKHKAPPVNDRQRAMVAERAAENRRRLTILAERRAAGLSVDPGELSFERWYRTLERSCTEIVERERAGRDAA